MTLVRSMFIQNACDPHKNKLNSFYLLPSQSNEIQLNYIKTLSKNNYIELQD